MNNNNRYQIDALDTMRLQPRERELLLNQLKNPRKASPASERRSSERLPYHIVDGIKITIDHPGGSEGTYLIQPVDLSSTGLRFLHGCYIYQDSRCNVELVTADGESFLVSGKIIWCSHNQRNIHEAALQFDNPIDPQLFLESANPSNTDANANEKLRGRVLYADDMKVCRSLFSHMAEKIGLTTTIVENGQEALQSVKTNEFNMILVDLWLGEMSGLDVIEQLRSSGHQMPIVLVTAEESPEILQTAIPRGANDVLTKPYTFDELKKMLVKHLPDPAELDESGAMKHIKSDYWSDTEMQPMILNYLDWLEQQMPLFEQSAQQQNISELVAICRDIKGTAGNYGYPQIVQIAKEILRMLAEDESCDWELTSLNNLASNCYAACRFKELSEIP